MHKTIFSFAIFATLLTFLIPSQTASMASNETLGIEQHSKFISSYVEPLNRKRKTVSEPL